MNTTTIFLSNTDEVLSAVGGVAAGKILKEALDHIIKAKTTFAEIGKNLLVFGAGTFLYQKGKDLENSNVSAAGLGMGANGASNCLRILTGGVLDGVLDGVLGNNTPIDDYEDASYDAYADYEEGVDLPQLAEDTEIFVSVPQSYSQTPVEDVRDVDYEEVEPEYIEID